MHENSMRCSSATYADMIAQASRRRPRTTTVERPETKTYVINPVDNLEEMLRAYGEALRAQAAERRTH